MSLLPEGVTWTQDDGSVEVTVAVENDAVRADLRVHTSADTLSVRLRTNTVWRPLLTGSLRNPVEAESCCWALEKTRKGNRVVVIQLEKESSGSWDALLRASVSGSILEEAGRDQVIVDAGASAAESLVCGRCGALVKSTRMEAHTTMWCEALVLDKAAGEPHDGEDESAKAPASHLYWARSPTNPAGTMPPQRFTGDIGRGEFLV